MTIVKAKHRIEAAATESRGAIGLDPRIDTLFVYAIVASLFCPPLLGRLPVVAFLGFGLLFVLMRFRFVLFAVKKNWLLFMFPVWGLITVGWSDYPSETIRSAVQIIITYLIILCVVVTVPLRKVLICISLVSLAVFALNFTSSRVEIISYTREVIPVGYFGSKNILALFGSSVVIFSLMLVAQSDLRSRTAWLGIGVCCLATLTLFQAKSLGALFFVGASGAIIWAAFNFGRIKSSDFARKSASLFAIVVALTCIFFAFSFVSYSEFGEIMESLGKDPTLTRRTYIWEDGIRQIQDHFWLGVGHAGFWQMDNPFAIDLWLSNDRQIGAGFGFHNEYIGIWVEMGFVGFVIVSTIMIKLLLQVWRAANAGLQGAAIFFSFFALFYFIRTFLESGAGLQQFSTTTFFLFFTWVHLNRLHVDNLEPDPIDEFDPHEMTGQEA